MYVRIQIFDFVRYTCACVCVYISLISADPRLLQGSASKKKWTRARTRSWTWTRMQDVRTRSQQARRRRRRSNGQEKHADERRNCKSKTSASQCMQPSGIADSRRRQDLDVGARKHLTQVVVRIFPTITHANERPRPYDHGGFRLTAYIFNRTDLQVTQTIQNIFA